MDGTESGSASLDGRLLSQFWSIWMASIFCSAEGEDERFAVTVTSSLISATPSRMRKGRADGVPASTVRRSSSKPFALADRVYAPAGRPENANSPASLQVYVSFFLPALCSSLTWAPGMGLPLGSTTVPWRDPAS